MIEYYNVDYTMSSPNEDIHDKRIYSIIENHVKNYITIYKKIPHIYVGKNCVSFLLFNEHFRMKSIKSGTPYIGMLCGCYIYISFDKLENNDLYLSPHKINFKQFKRKLKIEQLNNSFNENNKV